MWEFIPAGKAHMLVCTLNENLQSQMMLACLHHYYTHVCNIKYRLLGNLDSHSIHVRYIYTYIQHACVEGMQRMTIGLWIGWLWTAGYTNPQPHPCEVTVLKPCTICMLIGANRVVSGWQNMIFFHSSVILLYMYGL